MKTPNRLINEKSPYLLQHAYNPVDWYPWGEEAFLKAREEDKPIFLSIGYSTCYWCHVMEREVFEKEEIARIMNEKLVNIKVDREERPDIDRIYMNALIATTGQGGWPLSAFLTPDLKPFFLRSYIRPVAHHDMPGFPELVDRISDLWKNDRQKILSSSEHIFDYLKKSNVKTLTAVDEDAISKCYQNFLNSYDTTFGGFGERPKFPRPSIFNFLLRYFHKTGNGSSLKMVLNTLRAMASGGIYDQIGGGFHRYSVDERWHVPHFEKMLYDQAQLIISYLETYQITKDNSLLEVGRGILSYVLKKLWNEEGGFYSAEDAESAVDIDKPNIKNEGAFYVWTKSEIELFLGINDAEIFNFYFDVREEGNVVDDHLGVFGGKNILHISRNISETAKQFGKTPDEINKILLDAKHKLYIEREKRPQPHLDDKIITAWNGLMISALSKAYQILDDEVYRETAEITANFILEKLFDSQTKTLYRRYRDGEAKFDGGLQDYAFFVQGLIDLYETTFDVKWLEHAITLTKKQIELFWDQEAGGFFDNAGNDKSIILRLKDDYDAAEPTGNSISVMNLLMLAEMTNQKEWREMAVKTIQSFAARLNQIPEALPQMLSAMILETASLQEIIIVGERSSKDTKKVLKEIYQKFLPNKVIILVDDNSRTYFTNYLPFLKDMTMIDGRTTVYICKNYSCQLPTNELEKVLELLKC